MSAEGHIPKQTASIGMVARMEELGSAVHSRSEGGSYPSIACRRGLTAVRTEAGKVLDKRMTFIVNGQSIKKICKISSVLIQTLMEQEQCTVNGTGCAAATAV